MLTVLLDGLLGALGGQITDVTGKGLSDVLIQIPSLNDSFYSDSLGYFHCSDSLLAADIIIFSRIGFLKDTIQVSEQSFINVTMKIQPISLDQVVKTESVIQNSLDGSYNYLVNPAMGLQENKSAFRKVPGLQIRSYGGPAGIQTLSVDGGNARDVKIFFAGSDITPAQSNVLDISLLPFPMIRQLTFFPADQNAADGRINISADANHRFLQLSNGSFGHRSLLLTWSKPMLHIFWDVQVGIRVDEGNYPFKNWDGVEKSRQNNDYRQQFILDEVRWMLSETTYLDWLAFYTSQRRGVPALSWATPDTLSYRTDENHFQSLRLIWNKTKRSGSAGVSWRDGLEIYHNTLYFIHSRHREQLLTASLSDKYQWYEWFNVQYHIQTDYLNLQSSDLTKIHQINPKCNLSFWLNPGNGFEIQTSLNGQTDVDGQIFTGLFGEFSWHSPQQNWTYHGSAAKVVRLPSYNDLYWQPGGNSDLKPENTIAYLAGIKYFNETETRGYFEVFKKTSTDMIQWSPQAAYWTPQNIQSVLRTGFKAGAGGFISRLNSRFHIDYNHIVTEDRQRQKPLRYVPENSLNLSTEWSKNGWLIAVTARWQDLRIFMYNYPDDIMSEPFWTADITSSYSLKADWLNGVAVFSLTNFTDTRYESVLGYPEPGREYRITLQCNY